MKTLTLASICVLAHVFSFAQCNTFFPIRENVKVYYDHQDKKEKVTLRTTQKFTNVKGSGEAMTATVVQELIDVKKNDLIGTSESEWTCNGGTVHFTMNSMSMMDQSQMGGAEGMTMEVTGDKMDVPSSFEVGQTLKDVTYQMKMALNGVTMMNRNFTVTNRKVVAQENVTTPAGSYDCYKLTFTTNSQGFGGGTMNTNLWYAKDTGLVKSETFSENGKLMARQILTKIEK
jgi:hypothetical protein